VWYTVLTANVAEVNNIEIPDICADIDVAP